jgi:hypothetical protein
MTREDLTQLKKLSESINEFVESFEEFVSVVDKNEQTSTVSDQFLDLFPTPPKELFDLQKSYTVKCFEILKLVISKHPDSKDRK